MSAWERSTLAVRPLTVALRGVAILAFILAIALACAAQTPASDTSPDIPTFKARSELVVVPVLVLRHGEHVSGLRRDDFAIEEDGVRKTIASFDEIGNASQREPASLSSTKDSPSASLTVILFDLI